VKGTVSPDYLPRRYFVDLGRLLLDVRLWAFENLNSQNNLEFNGPVNFLNKPYGTKHVPTLFSWKAASVDASWHLISTCFWCQSPMVAVAILSCKQCPISVVAIGLQSVTGAMTTRPRFMRPCKSSSLDYRSLHDTSQLVNNENGFCVPVLIGSYK
jgi:hypothetical protein